MVLPDGVGISASLIMNFVKLSGSDSPTRFHDSVCDSFLESHYLTYQNALSAGRCPAVS